jgi:hypothetical protein
MKTRREVLVELSAGTLVLCLGCSGRDDSPIPEDARARRISLDAILPPQSVLLGREYLELVSRDGLERTPLDAMFGASGWIGLSPDEFRSQLRERVHTDFRRGWTVSLGGWILSATELELCAAFAEVDFAS